MHKSGTALGQQYDQYVETAKKSGELVTAVKKRFRDKWAQTQLEQVTKEKVHSKVWQNVDTKQGTYEPFAVVVEKMGFAYDPLGAIERAEKYCTILICPPFKIQKSNANIKFNFKQCIT